MRSKESFNKAAKLYDEVRPTYPQEAIDWIIEKAGISTNDELLEIAPGTGQATMRFAERGFKIHAVELGDKLAEILVENCKDMDFTVDVAPFEEWVPKEDKSYKLIYCATAFHWLDPNVSYKKTADLLEAGGYLTLLWNTAVGTTNEVINKAYDLLFSYYPERPFSTKPKSEKEIEVGQYGKGKSAIEDSGYYDMVDFYQHNWTINQSKEKTIKGFYSQSSFLSLKKRDKEELLKKLDVLFKELDDEIPTLFKTTVYLCKVKK